MSRRYLVLRSGPGELALFDTLQDALYALAPVTGLDMQYGYFDQPRDDLARHVYSEAQNRAVVTVVEDYATPVRYLMVEAGTRAEADAIANELAARLDIVTLEELQTRVRAQGEAAPEELVRLALATGEQPDEASRDIIAGALESPDPRVRLRAVEAVALTSWPGFRSLVEQLSRSDPSAEVRNMAARVIQPPDLAKPEGGPDAVG